MVPDEGPAEPISPSANCVCTIAEEPALPARDRRRPAEEHASAPLPPTGCPRCQRRPSRLGRSLNLKAPNLAVPPVIRRPVLVPRRCACRPRSVSVFHLHSMGLLSARHPTLSCNMQGAFDASGSHVRTERGGRGGVGTRLNTP